MSKSRKVFNPTVFCAVPVAFSLHCSYTSGELSHSDRKLASTIIGLIKAICLWKQNRAEVSTGRTIP